MRDEYSVTRKPDSITRLIAFLSVCMLAVAFGSMLDLGWGRIWGIFGAFGLTSAVALDALCRSRAQAKELRAREERSSRDEERVDKMMREIEASEVMSAALREIQPNVTDSEPQRGDLRDSPRGPTDAPVTITPLCPSSGKLGESLRGYVRNISRHGVSLAHDCFLNREFVLLEITGTNGKPILLTANMLWCEIQPSGQYFSGGKVVELLGPIGLDPSPRPAAGTSEADILSMPVVPIAAGTAASGSELQARTDR